MFINLNNIYNKKSKQKAILDHLAIFQSKININDTKKMKRLKKTILK